jgi:hypothetical protein
MILNMSTGTTIGGLIRMSLGSAYVAINGGLDIKRNCPNHDALVVEHNGRLWVGDSMYPRCKLTSLEDYDKALADGSIYNMRILRVRAATTKQHHDAAEWWIHNVLGTPYDWYAFPKLLIKAFLGDMFECVAGVRWAWYCTEGVMDSFSAQGISIYEKYHPTPLTTYKRMLDGKLDYVTKL